MARGNYAAAEAKFLESQDLWPGNPDGFVGRARILEMRACWSQALECWKEIAKKFPNNMAAKIGQANMYLELGEYPVAEAIFLEAQKTWPRKPNAFVGYARVAQCRFQWREALRRWTNVLKTFPENKPALIGLGNAHLELDDFSTAEAIFLEARNKWPDNPVSAVGYARAAQAQCHWVEALERWQEALARWRAVAEKSPGNLHALIGQANAFLELGNYAAADAIFVGLINDFPDSPGGFVGYARSAHMQCRWEEALVRWEEVLRHFPSEMTALVGKGNACLELNDYDVAETIFLRVQEQWPDNPRAFIANARVAQLQCNWEEALERWEKVLRKFPNNIPARIELGSVLLELGEFDKAEEIFLEAQKKWPNRNRPFYLHHRVLELQRRM